MAKIMLVEDDNNLREIYEARLLAEGYEIVSAADGEEALAIAVREHPDLIVADIMMPKISGFDMLDILRTTPETRDAKVIMMTALSQAEDKERANQLGADRYLVKSQVTLEDLANAVNEVLASEPQKDEDSGSKEKAKPSGPTIDETAKKAEAAAETSQEESEVKNIEAQTSDLDKKAIVSAVDALAKDAGNGAQSQDDSSSRDTQDDGSTKITVKDGNGKTQAQDDNSNDSQAASTGKGDDDNNDDQKGDDQPKQNESPDDAARQQDSLAEQKFEPLSSSIPEIDASLTKPAKDEAEVMQNQIVDFISQNPTISTSPDDSNDSSQPPIQAVASPQPEKKPAAGNDNGLQKPPEQKQATPDIAKQEAAPTPQVAPKKEETSPSDSGNDNDQTSKGNQNTSENIIKPEKGKFVIEEKKEGNPEDNPSGQNESAKTPAPSPKPTQPTPVDSSRGSSQRVIKPINDLSQKPDINQLVQQDEQTSAESQNTSQAPSQGNQTQPGSGPIATTVIAPGGQTITPASQDANADDKNPGNVISPNKSS